MKAQITELPKKIIRASIMLLWTCLVLPFNAFAAPTDALTWLSSQQNTSGSFGATSTSLATEVQSTAEVIRAYQTLNQQTQSAFTPALNFLNNDTQVNTEFLSRKIVVNAKAGNNVSALINQLLLNQNTNSGFGDQPGYASSAFDTAFALEALTLANYPSGQVIANAVGFLLSRQQADGGFADGSNTSAVYLTAQVMRALTPYATIYVGVAAALSKAQTFLLAQRNAAGLWNEHFETALALIALLPVTDPASLANGVNALQAAQLANGSWENDAYTTALALQGLFLAQNQPPAGLAQIHGTVKDAITALPLAGVSVQLTGPTPGSITTGSSGEFLFNGVTPGAYTVTLSLAGYSTLTTSVSTQSGQVRELGSLALTKQTNAITGTVLGTITDGSTNQPLAGVTITVSGVGSAITASDGTYQIANVPAGAITLQAIRAGYSSASGTANMVAGGTVIFSPTLFPASVPTTAIEGTITDGRNNTPLVGATVTLSGATQGSVTTDAQGHYRIDSLTPGTISISITLSGYDIVSASATVAQNTILQFSPKLFPTNTTPPDANSSSVKGVVLDAGSNQPLAGAMVQVVVGTTTSTITTATDGSFNITGLPSGQAGVTFSLSSYISQSVSLNLPLLTIVDFGQVRLRKETTNTLLPDLVVSSVDNRNVVNDPQTLKLSGTLDATIANTGTANAQGSFNVITFYDANKNGAYDAGIDIVLAQGQLSGSLNVSATQTITFPISGILPFRDAPISVWVDSDQTVAEGNETNNVNTSSSECNAALPVGTINPVLKWSWPNGPINHMPVVGPLVDTNGDGRIDQNDTPAVLVVAGTTLTALNGGTGQVLWQATGLKGGDAMTPALGDLDGDGRPEVVAFAASRAIIAFNNDGTTKWISAPLDVLSTGISLADLDGDGKVEILAANAALSADGSIRWVTSSNGVGPAAGPVVADLGGDGSPEVIIGPRALHADGTLYWELPASMRSASGTSVAIGNFDNDPYPEIVYLPLGQGRLFLLNHDGTVKWGPVTTNFLNGGHPLIADFDGDGKPEIGIPGLNFYQVFNSDGSLRWQAPIGDNSAVTASSAFDLDGDGTLEIAYGDEGRLAIFNGLTGALRFSAPNPSATWLEYPVIADVDNDGHADLVVSNATGVHVFQDKTWRPARGIWNQYSYHVTNVNTDGSIPRHEQNSWEATNTYRVQLPLTDQKIDLTAGQLRFSSGANGAALTVRIGNAGVASSPAGVIVGFYEGDPKAGGRLLGQVTLPTLAAGDFQDVVLNNVTGITGSVDLFAVVDADNRVSECNENNNTVSISGPSLKPDLIVAAIDTSAANNNPQTLVLTGSVVATVQNSGTLAVNGDIKVLTFFDVNRNNAYDAGDIKLGEAIINSAINAGASTTVTIPVSGTLPFRDAPISVWVDSDQQLAESNENNNVVSSSSACEVKPSIGTFQPVLKWHWQSSAIAPAFNQVMMAPIVAQTNDDNGDGKIDEKDIPDVIFVAFGGAGADFGAGILRIVSGKDGTELVAVPQQSAWLTSYGNLAVGDIDGDGFIDIVGPKFGGGLIAFNHDGAVKWSLSLPTGWNVGGASIADVDGDGIPEIIFGSYVINNNGTVRWQGTTGFILGGTHPNASLSIVADLDNDGKPEVIVGASAYTATGQLLWKNASVSDGFTAVGNFNNDPYPEVVVVNIGRVNLLDHLGNTIWGAVPLPGGGRGGPPTIADIDGDGIPEIGVAGASRYTVFKANGSILWSMLTQDASSNATGSSVFDFDGDGQAEIVYADETKLRVYRGNTGQVLFDIINSSGTAFELPVIADVDNDNHADLIVASNRYFGNTAGSTVGVRVFQDANNSWVNTRKIWNQHSYHITNINDDGTVPRVEQKSWQTHNTYRLNALLGQSATATPDLTAGQLRFSPGINGASLTVRIGNAGAASSPSGVLVSFYEGNPQAGGRLLGEQTLPVLTTGSFQDITLSAITSLAGDLDLYAVVDSNNKVTECRENNNSVSIPGPKLAPDLTISSIDASQVSNSPQTLVLSGTLNVMVKNQGLVGAISGFRLLAFYDVNGDRIYQAGIDKALGTTTINSPLAVGATQTVDIIVSGTSTFRDAPISVWVDSNQEIAESNESNNVSATTSACQFTPSVGTFQPVLKWQWTESNVLPQYNQVIMAPVVAQTNDDNGDGKIDQNDIPDVIFISYRPTLLFEDGVLRILSGKDGAELVTVTNPAHRLSGPSSLAVADIDGDGLVEIVGSKTQGGLVAFNHDGTVHWELTSPLIPSTIRNWGSLAIADLDGDGAPEIIFGTVIVNNNGTIRWIGSGAFRGENFANSTIESVNTLAADIDPTSPGLEVVAGASVYDKDGKLIWINSAVGDGFTAIGNFNADPAPEVVVVSLGRVFLLNHKGQIIWGPVSLPGGGSGGPPTVADMDGDGVPEIGVAGASRYVAFKADGSVLWTSVTQDQTSNVTGSSVFDFDGDGKSEVAYADETTLRVYDGATGLVRFSLPNDSGTWVEYPVIADIDNDNHADMVVVANTFLPGATINGIRVFQDANNSWVNTRKIWNQHSYHITNINDDGSVPRVEQNSWQVHNTYRLNAQPGLTGRELADLTISLLSVVDNGAGQGITLNFRVGNGGAVSVAATQVAFYEGDPAGGGVLLGSTTVNAIPGGGFKDGVFNTTATLSGSSQIYVVVNGANVLPSIPISLSPWLGYAEVSSPGIVGANTSSGRGIAVSPTGSAIMVWRESDNAGFVNVYASRRDPQQGEVERIVLHSNKNAETPEIVVDGVGNFIVSWREFTDINDQRIWTREYKVGQGWLLAEELPGVERGRLEEPHLASNANGDAVLTWRGYPNTIWAVYRRAGTSWSSPYRVVTENVSLTNNVPAMDAAGNVVMVWSAKTGKPYADNRAARYVAGQGWQLPQNIEFDDSWHATQPQVALRDNGEGMAVWIQGDSTGQYSVWTNRLLNGQWQGAVLTWKPPVGQVDYPDFAWDKNGNGLMVWHQSTGPLNAPSIVWVARYDRVSGWQTAMPLYNSTGLNDPAFRIAFDNYGDAMVVWADGVQFRRIWSRYYNAVKGWEDAKLVQDDNFVGFSASFSFDNAGSVYLIWDQVVNNSGKIRFAKRIAQADNIGVSECRYDNNVTHVPAIANVLGHIAVSTDKPVYGPNSNVTLQGLVTNKGSLSANFAVELKIEDDQGALVQTFAAQPVTSLSGGTSTTVNSQWNTGVTLAGNYHVRGMLRDETGGLVSQASADFSISNSEGASPLASLRVTTDRPVYHTTDNVTIESLINNLTANVIIEGTNLKLTVKDANNQTVFTNQAGQLIGQLVPNALRDLYTPYTYNNLPLGIYTIQGQLLNAQNNVLASSSATFEIRVDLSKSLAGKVQVALDELQIGQNQICIDSVTNQGNLAALNLEVHHALLNLDTQQLISETVATINLAAGITDTSARNVATSGLTAGNYACALQVKIDNQLKTLAFTPFVLKPTPIRVEGKLDASTRGRLLVLLDNPQQDNNDPFGPSGAPTLSVQRTFLETLLKDAGWSYTITESADAFTTEFRSGNYNTYALFNEQEKLSEQVQRELRDAILRGQALLIAGVHDHRDLHRGKLLDALGIELSGHDPKALEVDLIASPLNLSGRLTLLSDDQVLRIKRNVATSAGVYVQHSQGNNDPDALILNNFGKGKAAFAAFDLLAMATLEGLTQPLGLSSQVLINALNWINPIQTNTVGSVKAIELQLTNQGNATTATAAVRLPTGVIALDPGAGQLDQNELVFTTSLDAGESKTFPFWVKLPATPGPITFTATLSAGNPPIAQGTTDYVVDVIQPKLAELTFIRDKALYKMDVDTAGLTSLTTPLKGGFDTGLIKISPDGQKIAFQRFAPSLPGSYSAQVWTINTDGTQLIQVSPKNAYSETFSWAADSTKLAINANSKLYMVNANGSGLLELTHAPNGAAYPNYAPDSSAIVFAYTLPQQKTQIYTIKPDGSNLTNLSKTSGNLDLDPVYSPDGTKIAFTRYLAQYKAWTGDLFVMDSDGSNKANLTNSQDAYGAAWSPDGTKIAFTRKLNTNAVDLFIANLSAQTLTRLTTGLSIYGIPQWVANGAKLVFSSSYDIYTVDADGTHLINLTNTPTNSETFPAYYER